MEKQANDILILSNNITPRVEYVFNIVFKKVLGIKYNITANRNFFRNSYSKKINYSATNTKSTFQIFPYGLLEEENIRIHGIHVSRWRDLPVFFQTQSPDIPFDLFSAVFYLVTRYEEYLPFIPDEHGRFNADQSLAWREHFLRIPIVDFWCIELAKQLGIVKSCRNIQAENYRFTLTVDIDTPWIYRNKGFIYTTGALLKDLISLKFDTFLFRYQVLTNKKPDPGDNYAYLSRVEEKLKRPIRYFVLCRKKRPYDLNASAGKKAFHDLLQQLDQPGNVGIHPSYVSAGYAPFLQKEINCLSRILKRKIEASRQHFLRLSLPVTYRNLIELGIKCDYSMGFAAQTGFRAGIARPFNFYDLWEEKETKLKVVPFQVMDRTLLSYLNYTPEQAIEEFTYYTQLIKSVGGEFVCLWHNESLGDWVEWKGWKKVFKKMIEMNKI